MKRSLHHELVKALQDFFKKENTVAAVYVFGSFGTEYENPMSDVDLGVLFSCPVSFADELDMDVRLTMSIHVNKEIDFVNLNRAPLPLQFRALREGTLIYEGDYLFHSNFIEYVIKNHFEYQLRFPEFRYIPPEGEYDYG